MAKQKNNGATVANTTVSRETFAVDIHSVRVRKEYTKYALVGGKPNPKGEGKVHLPAPPSIEDGALEDDLLLEGRVGDDVRVHFIASWQTFPFRLDVPAQAILPGRYQVEDVMVLEAGDPLELASGESLKIGERELKGCKQLWLGSYATFIPATEPAQ